MFFLSKLTPPPGCAGDRVRMCTTSGTDRLDMPGAPLDAALELFGSYFVDFAARAGFIRLLRSLGAMLSFFSCMTD